MTYLARMLARAGIVGDPGVAAARPRLPSRFELPGEETADLVEPTGTSPDAVAAPPAAQQPAGRAAAAVPGRGTAPAAFPVRPTAAATRASTPPGQRPTPQEVQQPAAAAQPIAAEPRAERAVPVADRPQSEPAPAVAAVAPLTAAVPSAMTHPGAAATGQQSARPGRDVVEVSIGRIEVRASIAREPAPAPPLAAAPSAAPAVLSLTDYLRGKREAR